MNLSIWGQYILGQEPVYWSNKMYPVAFLNLGDQNFYPPLFKPGRSRWHFLLMRSPCGLGGTPEGFSTKDRQATLLSFPFSLSSLSPTEWSPTITWGLGTNRNEETSPKVKGFLCLCYRCFPCVWPQDRVAKDNLPRRALHRPLTLPLPHPCAAPPGLSASRLAPLPSSVYCCSTDFVDFVNGGRGGFQ